jgi:hypothetical protein
MNFSDISALLQVYLPLLPLVLAILLGQWRSARLHFSLVFLLASLLINISFNVFKVYYILGRDLSELFDILLIVSLGFMFYKQSQKKSFLAIGLVLLLAYITIRLIFQPSSEPPNISSVAGNMAIMLLCFKYFYFLIQSETEIGIHQNIVFSNTVIVFFYATGGFFTFLLIEYIRANNGERYYLYSIQSWISIISYLAFTYLITKQYLLQKKTLSRVY